MQLMEYAQNLLAREDNDRSVRRWAHETQRLVAWHTLCLVPYQEELAEVERKEHLDLLAETLSYLDPRQPLAVPLAVRTALLETGDARLAELVQSRTVLPDGP